MTGNSTLTVNTDFSENDVVITMVGSLDRSTVTESRRGFQRLLNAGHRSLIIDVALLDACDAIGVALLLDLHCVCRTTGGGLRIVAPPRWLREMLDKAQLMEMLAAYPTVLAARDGWQHERILATLGPASCN